VQCLPQQKYRQQARVTEGRADYYRIDQQYATVASALMSQAVFASQLAACPWEGRRRNPRAPREKLLPGSAAEDRGRKTRREYERATSEEELNLKEKAEY
jgi:hypothetical protein